MKKNPVLFLLIVLLATAFLGWKILSPNTFFKDATKTIYIRTDHTSKEEVVNLLKADSVIKNEKLFLLIANKMKTWERIRPGKFIIKKESSLLSLSRMLRNNEQATVNLVITKLRTKQDLARLVSRKLERDSLQIMNFLNSEDSLSAFNVSPETVFTFILPNTYTFYWTTSAKNIFKKLFKESERFWDTSRKQKAASLGITPQQAYILASIVEEETNAKTDKPKITSVFLNRISKGMPLQADPTVKYALQDFGIKRILHKHLLVESPYNTYRRKGLPPGPICTPSLNTIDEVLNSTKTDYLFFVANSDFSGTHIFTTNYTDHIKYAKEYHIALTKLLDSLNKKNNP